MCNVLLMPTATSGTSSTPAGSDLESAQLAQTRVLVPQHGYDDFIDAMASMADGLVVGDPSDPATEYGVEGLEEFTERQNIAP